MNFCGIPRQGIRFTGKAGIIAAMDKVRGNNSAPAQRQRTQARAVIKPRIKPLDILMRPFFSPPLPRFAFLSRGARCDNRQTDEPAALFFI